MNNSTTPQDIHLDGFKSCGRCHVNKPFSAFYKVKKSKDGHGFYCKECTREMYKSRKRYPPTDQSKQCRDCGRTLPAKMFRVNFLNVDGRSYQCSDCDSVDSKIYNEKNKEKIKTRMQQWYLENRSVVREKQNTRYSMRPKHRDYPETKECVKCNRVLPSRNFTIKRDMADGLSSICKRCKQKYDKKYRRNPERIARYKTMWATYTRRRKERMSQSQAQGTHTKQEILALFQQQHGRCWWCGKKLKSKWQTDHRIPVSKGGSDDISNIVITCPHCNQSKHDKLPYEWNGRLL